MRAVRRRRGRCWKKTKDRQASSVGTDGPCKRKKEEDRHTADDAVGTGNAKAEEIRKAKPKAKKGTNSRIGKLVGQLPSSTADTGGRRDGAGRKKFPDDLKDRKVSEETVETAIALEPLYEAKKYPRPPKSLTDFQYAKWTEVIHSYVEEGLNIFSICDVPQLVMYCEACERYETAKETWNGLIKKTGGKVVSKSTDVTRQISDARKAMTNETTLMMKLSSELCLTPSGRKKYASINDYDDDDDGMDFLDSLGEE